VFELLDIVFLCSVSPGPLFFDAFLVAQGIDAFQQLVQGQLVVVQSCVDILQVLLDA
jgi:hypothetical protein